MGCGYSQNARLVKTYKDPKREVYFSGNIEKHYKIIDTIGTGCFGIVKCGKKLGVNDQRKFAIKSILKEKFKGRMDYVVNEITVLQMMDHPNVVNFYEAYEDNRYIHLVMEYCSGGDLLDRLTKLKTISEKDAAHYIEKIFLAINYMHRCHVVHRDIKAENFLFVNESNESELKVIDFGLSSKHGKDERLTTKLGTPTYMAPEIIARTRSYSKKCDSWSLGILLHWLLVGHPPFHSENIRILMENIRTNELVFSAEGWSNISDDAKDLVRKLLIKDPQQRYTVKQAIDHPWIIKNKGRGLHISNLNTKNLNSLKQLNTYHTRKKFAKEALNVITKMWVKEEKIQHLKLLFEAFDTDQSGTISLTELKLGLKKSRVNIDERSIQDIYAQMEFTQSQEIDYSEFIQATIDVQQLIKKEELHNAFNYFATSNSGYITHKNIKDYMKKKGANMTNLEIRQMIEEFDTNKDGKISYEEFEAMVLDKDCDFNRI